MVTPSQPTAAAGSAAAETHRYRAIAESFGVDPAAYDGWRSRYPASLIDRIVDTSPGRRFLDVGIGTGIDARQFRDAGAEVTGIEPDLRMAAFARNDGFPVYESSFEDWDPAGRTFDAVVAAQSWHWVDPVAGAIKARQVLRSGGRLALFWNVGDAPQSINEAYADAFCEAVPNSPVRSAVRHRPRPRPTGPSWTGWPRDSGRPEGSTKPSIGRTPGTSRTPARSTWPCCRPRGC